MTTATPIHEGRDEDLGAEYAMVIARTSGELLRSVQEGCRVLLADAQAESPIWERLAEFRASIQAAQDLNDELLRCFELMNFRAELNASPRESAADAAAEPECDGCGCPALVVERDDGLRALIAEVLRRHGYVVLEARSAEEAEKVLGAGKRPVQIVVMEMVLDDGSGISLASKLRSKHPRIKVVYTASEYQLAIVPAGALGSDALLKKPFNVAGILGAVKEASQR